MKTTLDLHGQPLNRRFNGARISDRDTAELLGLVKGLLADGRISEEEIDLVNSWIKIHPEIAQTRPASAIRERLERIFKDGVISDEERQDLLGLLTSLVGGKAGIIGHEIASTELPLDNPAPQIRFQGNVFVLTGRFAFGPRKECQRFTTEAGGTCEDSVTLRTNYLIIGTFGSSDWVESSYGRKIEKAVQYRGQGCQIRIVSEDHWANSLRAA